MPAGTYNITIEQGAAWDWACLYRSSDGTPVNLTGWSARMQIRRFANGPVLADLSTANGRIALGGSRGTIALHLPASATTSITVPGVWDLTLIPPSGPDNAIRLLQGRMRASRAVTSA